VLCLQPPQVFGARLVFRGLTFGSFASYRCLGVSSIDGSIVRQVTCSLGGLWVPDPSRWRCTGRFHSGLKFNCQAKFKFSCFCKRNQR